MNEPVRIALRLLGLVLFVASIAGVVLFVAIGPDDIARGMGRECAHNSTRADWCTWQDALDIMQMLPWTALVGGVLLVVMQRSFVGRAALDGAAPRRPGSGRFGSLGGFAVVALLLVTFPGVFIYRAAYTTVTTAKNAKEVLDSPRPDFSDRSVPSRTGAPGPRGLARGSLLRADAFRSAVRDLRRAAPAGAQLSGLRVAADRVEAEVVAGGRVLKLRRTWNGKAKVISRAPADELQTAIVTFASLDRAAPQRIAVAAARATDQRPRDVDYLVLIDAAGLRWNAFMAGGKGQLTASPDGRDVQPAPA